MTIWQSILLGIIQGLTEFLPISSSAHLVLVPYLLDWQIPAKEAFIFDVLVQVASLLAVFIFFYRDLLAIIRASSIGLMQKQPFQDPNARTGWLLILATIPAGVLGLILKNAVERTFANPIYPAIFLLFTASFLFLAERVGKRVRNLEELNWKDAMWVGAAQALAIFPGISRSAAAISAGMMRDFERTSATRFAMLLSIPVMLAAGLLSCIDLLRLPNFPSLTIQFVPGFIASAITSYLSIRWLLRYLSRHPLYLFSIYCGMLGLIVLGTVFWGK